MRRKQSDDEIAFNEINLAIDQLLKKLRNVCPCCVAAGLLFRGAFLHQQVVGTEETIELCHDIAALIEHFDDDGGMLESRTQH